MAPVVLVEQIGGLEIHLGRPIEVFSQFKSNEARAHRSPNWEHERPFRQVADTGTFRIGLHG